MLSTHLTVISRCSSHGPDDDQLISSIEGFCGHSDAEGLDVSQLCEWYKFYLARSQKRIVTYNLKKSKPNRLYIFVMEGEWCTEGVKVTRKKMKEKRKSLCGFCAPLCRLAASLSFRLPSQMLSTCVVVSSWLRTLAGAWRTCPSFRLAGLLLPDINMLRDNDSSKVLRSGSLLMIHSLGFSVFFFM